MNSHLFTRQLPTKRKNARGNAELTPANGGISYDADALLGSYAEGDTAYKMGTNGLRDNPHATAHRAVAGDFTNFAEDTIVDSTGQDKIRVRPEMKNLVMLLGSHAEPAGDFHYSEDQMRALRRFFNDEKKINAANELVRLRNLDTAPTARQRTRRMELETAVASMKTQLSSMLRSA